ncbi:putative hydrolase/acyltransferase (alpha/beta hydrolase superfamily) [Handroanthus impetiginosus]|uniref:Putative hydrolase/acyltransferase (Alpha/beta hydrolase superfamily) n=1 Tax=Handroanthus impetiginosus TaxID=429701 RepID=A0A2G9GIT2_9LAMI|nr:putative hydrolase/acyltransferase (alpha/beta hydrolase superfamily) [Handroanthus impetiginosus]
MSICYGNHQLVFVSPPKPPKFSYHRKSLLRVQFGDAVKWDSSHFSYSFSSHKPIWGHGYLVRAASAASSGPLSGSGAEYSEQLQGTQPKEKTKRIAGIDQEEIDDPTLLADSDSCFCEFNGVQIHHKISDAELSALDTIKEGLALQSTNYPKRVHYPVILLHGFGASVFSWNRVMKPLAQVSGSKVLAFDRPAFGLTSRVDAVKHPSPNNQDTCPFNPYSMMFAVLATLYFIDFLAAQKAILVGHSAGALVAVDAYFEAPERIAALILVAPAILAPFAKQNVVKQNQARINNQVQNSSDSNTRWNLFSRLSSMLAKFTKYIAEAIVNMVTGMADMINSLYKKALSAILRSAFGLMLIRMIIDKFGIAAVRNAWYDSSQVSDHVLQGYTKPLKVKGWDKALVEYTIAMLTDSASKLKQPLPKRLHEISCPVLIVTGDTDRLVPSWNAERLSRAIPGSCFEIIKNCGHLPQEEKPEEFLSIVDKFLQRVFGAAEEPRLQAVST